MEKETTLIVVNTDATLEENESIKDALLKYIEVIVGITPMNLDRLDRIVASTYFAHELEHISLFTNNKVKYTNNQNNQAIAKCVTLKDGDDFIDILVLSGVFISMMFKDAESALNILHHELIHIYDNGLKDTALYHFNRQQVTELQRQSFPTILSTWAEFFANYSSAPTLTNEALQYTLENFYSNLITFEENVVDKHRLYQNHKIDLDTFLGEYFTVYANGLYLAAAYTIGSCHGMKKPLEQVSPEIYATLKDHLFLGTFEEMEIILLDMLDKYPKLWDESIYNPLNENLLKFYKKLGVSYREVPSINGGIEIWADIF